ncbi:MAG: L-serine ammonia-lyase [Acidobacteriota bacterium]|nr:L-serine ammonia-lyase [Acidobacteriota bacterium]
MRASSIGAFQTFKMSVGPSSSHTHGPILIGNMFRRLIQEEGVKDFDRLKIHLYWSLARTGKGHLTDNAIIAGLMGLDPVTDDLEKINTALARTTTSGMLSLGVKEIAFNPVKDFVWSPFKRLPGHENGMNLSLLDADGAVVFQRNYYSVGGGMVQEEGHGDREDTETEPFPYRKASEWLAYASKHGLPLSDIVKQNTAALEGQTVDEVVGRMHRFWDVMKRCVERGLKPTETVLPGVLQVKRRAPQLLEAAVRPKRRGIFASNDICRYATAFAYAVSEENAASGRVVTAPTNGGAGVLPGVLYAGQYLDDFSDDEIVEVLFTAAGIGGLIQANASISGSEVGCQGEVGAACSMAAGAVCQLFGGDIRDTEYAAEIAMEHSLGLECTPMKGYVQIPCIERNGIFAQKALAAAQHAITLKDHRISLDLVIEKMYENGKYMHADFKETSRKGFGPIVPDLHFEV